MTRFSSQWVRLAYGVALACLVSSQSAFAGQIYGGSASFTFTEGLAASINTLDAVFDQSTTRTNALSSPAPGNVPWTLTGSTAAYTDVVRPSGAVPPTGTGRTEQSTTLNVNTSDVLGNWAASTDSGAFVGSSSSQQIALSDMTRWTGPFTGVLLYGDFAIRNTSDRAGIVESGGTLSGLVITSNIDFANAVFADIANATITANASTLTIDGDLLIGQALNLLDTSAVVGTDFGHITLVANLTPVPEPSTVALLMSGSFIAGFARFRVRFKRVS